jgi:hypothetical protein
VDEHAHPERPAARKVDSDETIKLRDPSSAESGPGTVVDAATSPFPSLEGSLEGLPDTPGCAPAPASTGDLDAFARGRDRAGGWAPAAHARLTRDVAEPRRILVIQPDTRSRA